jgi:hypothetical protein
MIVIIHIGLTFKIYEYSYYIRQRSLLNWKIGKAATINHTAPNIDCILIFNASKA